MATRCFLFCFLVVCAAGCSPTNSNQSGATEKQLQELRTELDQAKEAIEELQVDVVVAKLVRDLDGSAFMRPGDDGYSLVRYDLGTLTVTIDDISPYANGSKVTLRFGNPLASAVTGLKTKVEWGMTQEDGTSREDTVRSKDITLTETLMPGAWTQSTLVLDGLPPTSLGFVRLSNVTHTGVRLSR